MNQPISELDTKVFGETRCLEARSPPVIAECVDFNALGVLNLSFAGALTFQPKTRGVASAYYSHMVHECDELEAAVIVTDGDSRISAVHRFYLESK